MIAAILIGFFGMVGVIEDPASSGPVAKPRGMSRFEYAETHMGSTFKLVLYSTDESVARDASRDAYRRIKQLDEILSDYQAESEISRLSARAGSGPVQVGPDLFDILTRSRRFWVLTDGAFDVTMAPVGRLWRRARREGKLPEPGLLAEALKLVGAQNMILDPERRTVQLDRVGMKLDVGGIAKGYASQAAIEVLRSHGISRALVAGAGDIVVGDAPPDAKGWKVAIAPLDPSGEKEPRMIHLVNAAVSTSGDAERFVVIGGKRYSHIVNPKTGLGVTDRASVTVVAEDGATADALSTAIYLLGQERGMKLAASVPRHAVYDVRKSESGVRTVISPGFQSWLDR